MKHFAAIALVWVLLCTLILAEKLDFQSASLKRHNELRRLHVNTPDMIQDAELNKLAQKCSDFYVQQGKSYIPHSCPYKNGAGENIAGPFNGTSEQLSYFGDENAVASYVANGFYGEIKDYNWDKPGFSKVTGHFTQLVWIGSTKLGSGYSIAKNGTTEIRYFVNLYLEPGNVIAPGFFQANVQKLKPV